MKDMCCRPVVSHRSGTDCDEDISYQAEQTLHSSHHQLRRVLGQAQQPVSELRS